MVSMDLTGFEPVASALRRRRSTTDLQAQFCSPPGGETMDHKKSGLDEAYLFHLDRLHPGDLGDSYLYLIRASAAFIVHYGNHDQSF